jgi:hypothetical protein
MTSQSQFVKIRHLFRKVKSQIEDLRLLSLDRLYSEDPDKFDKYFIGLEKRCKRATLELNGIQINSWYLLWRKISRKVRL